MWVFLALLGALATAGLSLSLKYAVAHGGAIVSTIAARLVAAALLGALVLALGGWPEPSPEYWRALALVLVPEVMGTLFLTLALRAGDLSLVQPLLGLLPPLVMLGGFVVLGEVPTPLAVVGAALVALGVYCVGLAPGASALEPLRALARERASWYAVASACSWSVATLVHRRGVAAVGAFPWGVSLALGTALALAALLPLAAWGEPGRVGLPLRRAPWGLAVSLAGLSFAVQQVGLQQAFGMTQAGYVMAVSTTGILISTALGIVLLRERAAMRSRMAGAVLVCGGAALVAAFG